MGELTRKLGAWGPQAAELYVGLGEFLLWSRRTKANDVNANEMHEAFKKSMGDGR